MAVIVGERRTRFWCGEKFTFERVDKGVWKIVAGNKSMIPADIVKEVKSWG